MDEITSTEFRRRYASLTKPTIVTVLGRAIGVWSPAAHPMMDAVGAIDRVLGVEVAPLESVRSALKGARGAALDSGDQALDTELGAAIEDLDRFNSRGSRPVPKGK